MPTLLPRQRIQPLARSATSNLVILAIALTPTYGLCQNTPSTESQSESRKEFVAKLKSEGPNLKAALSGTDKAAYSAAIAQIDEWLEAELPLRRVEILQLLVDSKRYEEAESRAVKYILKSAYYNGTIAALQKFRAHSFLKQSKFDAALSASKTYYRICPFEKTKDAISLVAICLIKAKPNDKDIAKKFNEQQVRGSVTTQPANPEAQSDIKDESLLVSVPDEDSAIYTDEIATRPDPITFAGYTIRGNLYLLAGKPTDAKDAFDVAIDLANDKQAPLAIENVARAMRAIDFSVGNANEFLRKSQ